MKHRLVFKGLRGKEVLTIYHEISKTVSDVLIDCLVLEDITKYTFTCETSERALIVLKLFALYPELKEKMC